MRAPPSRETTTKEVKMDNVTPIKAYESNGEFSTALKKIGLGVLKTTGFAVKTTIVVTTFIALAVLGKNALEK
jgi:hypothetical protein